MAGHAPSETSPEDVALLPVDGFRRRMLMALIMAATVMQVLDSTIANVALPHMQGALGATPDTITWVLTSYIVAAAVATPVTGWLADRIGRRMLMLSAIFTFSAASALCAVSTSLPMMVVARLLQGTFGAFLVPLGQALMLDIHPRSKHAQALTIWGLVVMVGPVVGPILGGWLTDAYSWRWVFLINVPIGLVALLGFLVFMPRAPTARSRFDMTGFVLILIGIAGLQFMLDRGQQNDWFSAAETIVELAAAVCGFWAFAVHTFTADAPLMPRALFGDRNLLIASGLLFLNMGLVIASAAILPSMLQQLMGFTAYTAGVLTASRGVSMCAAMLVAGRLSRWVDGRVLILFGLGCVVLAVHVMTGFSLEMDGRLVVMSGLLQGFGMGFVMLPINLLAFATLDPKLRTQGASLYSLSRNIGGSIAISLVTALIARQTQISHADLAAHVTTQSIPYFAYGALPQITGELAGYANAEITRQAAMVAYVDAYVAMFWLIVVASPLVLLMRPPRARSAEDLAHAAAVE